jgi:hypothetical protein
MLGFRRRPVALFFFSSALSSAACTGVPPEPRVLGEVPTAVTTAVPEWLPKRVRSGTAVADDSRETRLTETRRLTTGFDVDELAFVRDVDALVLLGRAPGRRDTTVVFIDLASGEASVGSGGAETRSVSVSAQGQDALFVTVEKTGTRLEELTVARAVSKLFGVPSKDGAFAVGDVTVSRAAIAPDAERAYVVGRSPRDASRSLFAVSRGSAAPSAPIATGVAEVTPAVSPDRAYLSFVREAAGDEQALVVASVEGRSPRELDQKARFASIAFHPSDGSLVYGSDRDAAAFELYRAAATGERTAVPERLTFQGAKSLAFSPDGRLIAYTSRRAGDTLDVYVSRYRGDH